jgi:hypothetical protein
MDLLNIGAIVLAGVATVPEQGVQLVPVGKPAHQANPAEVCAFNCSFVKEYARIGGVALPPMTAEEQCRFAERFIAILIKRPYQRGSKTAD